MNEDAFKHFQFAQSIIAKLKAKDVSRVHRAVNFSRDTYRVLDLPASEFEENQKFAEDLGLRVNQTDHMSSDAVVQLLHSEIQQTSFETVFRAFVVGLSPKQVRWRAPMRAYAAYAQLPLHSCSPLEDYHERLCSICGSVPKEEWKPVDLALGVCCAGTPGNGPGETVAMISSAMTLRWLRESDPPSPTADDRNRMESILGAIASAPESTTANALDSRLRPTLKTDKYTRRYLIETLGLMGVLLNPRQPPDIDTWTNWEKRDFGKHKNQEIIPPACNWRRHDGVNTERINIQLRTLSVSDK